MTASHATLTPDRCRRARELLGWSQERLAGEAGLDRTTPGYFERGRPTSAATVGLIARALEAGGVEFLPEGDVRLRERQGEARA